MCELKALRSVTTGENERHTGNSPNLSGNTEKMFAVAMFVLGYE